MKYVLLYFIEEGSERPPEEFEDAREAIMSWLDRWQSRGAIVAGERLRPGSDATTVRVRNGEILVTDGPFAETKEQIAGFDVIDAPTSTRRSRSRRSTRCQLRHDRGAAVLGVT